LPFFLILNGKQKKKVLKSQEKPEENFKKDRKTEQNFENQ
jgi:hypothetical protein